jgi:hypothetical protein
MTVDLRFEAGEGIQRFDYRYDEAEKDFLKKRGGKGLWQQQQLTTA